MQLEILAEILPMKQVKLSFTIHNIKEQNMEYDK